jgi:hypothetical protein
MIRTIQSYGSHRSAASLSLFMPLPRLRGTPFGIMLLTGTKRSSTRIVPFEWTQRSEVIEYGVPVKRERKRLEKFFRLFWF